MRIAIDARELQLQPTGVGRFLAGVLDAWKALPAGKAHDVVLCAPDGRDRRGTAWEQFVLPRLVRDARSDVLFAPAYTGPVFPGVPMVAAIYDVSFAAHPEWFSSREGLRRRLLTRVTAHRAARVLTTSHFSKREIVRCLGVDERKIDVVYPGPPAVPSPPATGREREDLVLFVGSLFTRRHIPALIEGFTRVAADRPTARLEIVGDNRTHPAVDVARLVAGSPAAARIALRSYVTDEVLFDLYSRARAFVFLSEYEGFGLTPLEALAADVPIVVLDTPIAREVYGDAAHYVPAPDPALVHAALGHVLSDETERRRILDAAARTLERYSWTRCAAAVLDVLVKAAGR